MYDGETDIFIIFLYYFYIIYLFYIFMPLAVLWSSYIKCIYQGFKGLFTAANFFILIGFLRSL